MVKNAALSIRIAPELKDQLEGLAANAGMSVASYAERALKLHAAPLQWVLSNPELTHSLMNGAQVKLPVAEGLPLAFLTPEHAAALGGQLLHAAQVASVTPVGSRSRIDACVQDVIGIAQKPDVTKERKLIAIQTRINKFLSDLDDHIKDWPNQDRGLYISKLEDALTAASTARARSDRSVSDLLERGIDHLRLRRRK
jgi:hypothetical protein